LALAKAGFKLKGLELSSEMLVKAVSKAEAAGLSELVSFQQADMRSFALAERYALILVPFNALMHLYTLKDQDDALSCIYKHLKEEGLLALDLYNPRFENLEVLTKQAEWDKVGGQHSELFLYQSHDADKQILNSTYYLDTVNQEAYLQRKTATLKQRYYTRFELERALLYAGFKHLRFFGDFDRSPYSIASSHLIVLAKK
jgi:SAM-dependent methyltransferase